VNVGNDCHKHKIINHVQVYVQFHAGRQLYIVIIYTVKNGVL
jgi:hypothetical protein